MSLQTDEDGFVTKVGGSNRNVAEYFVIDQFLGPLDNFAAALGQGLKGSDQPCNNLLRFA